MVLDFGLARQLPVAEKWERPAAFSSSLSGGIGTALYSAPEQLRSTAYGKQVDIYSLGILFLEVFNVPCSTRMEFARLVETVRGADLCKEIILKLLPEGKMKAMFQSLIFRCLSQEPRERPGIEELACFSC